MNLQNNPIYSEDFSLLIKEGRDLVCCDDSTSSENDNSTLKDYSNYLQSNLNKKIKINISSLVKDLVVLVQDFLKSFDIELVVKVKNADDIYTYENAFKQALYNIIKNAQEILVQREIYSPTLTIEVNKNEIEIYDNGGGISTDIIKDIFKPNFTTKKSSSGMGLYISKHIVEKYCNGKISVSNITFIDKEKKVMEGAKFKISLPNINQD